MTKPAPHTRPPHHYPTETTPHTNNKESPPNYAPNYAL